MITRNVRNYEGVPPAQPNINAKRVLFWIWWDSKGVLYYELLQPVEKVTRNRYQEQLINLDDALEEKNQFTGKIRRKVTLLYNNAQSHIAKATQDHILALDWELLPHASYDYYLLRSLQHHLDDRHFVTLKEIRKYIDDLITSKPVNIYH